MGQIKHLQLATDRVHWTVLAEVSINGDHGALPAYFFYDIRHLLVALLVLSALAMIMIVGITSPVVRIHQDVTFDRLTGALTRTEFDRQVSTRIASRRHERLANSLVAVALDLDGFKQVNDSAGHDAGDEILQEFSRRMLERIRKTDVFGRTGGDEFALLMALTPSVDVFDTIEKLRTELVAVPMLARHGQHCIGVTAGIAVARNGDTPCSLLMRADQALIAGKVCHKNRSYLAVEPESAERSLIT